MIRMIVLLFTSFFMVALPAGGQGCSMCYNNAAAANARQQGALRKGIWVLGTPAVLFMAGIALVAYRSNREE